MDFSQIQHGNIPLDGLLSNPEFSDLLGDDFAKQYAKYKPEDDAKLIVRFFSAPVLLSWASEQLRKPRVVQSDYIAIRLDEYSEHIIEVGFRRDEYGKPITSRSGEKIPSPAREEYLARFPKAWERYQRQFEKAEGTPLAQLPGITISDIAELGVYKIYTIEALKDASDRLFIGLDGKSPFLDVRDDGGSYFELRESARRYIKENGEFESVVKAKMEAEAEVIAMKAELAKLRAALASTGPTTQEKIEIENAQAVMDERTAAQNKMERRR